MLMTEGKIIYFNDAKKAVDHFSSLRCQGTTFKCPEHSNPADYFMEIMSKSSIPIVYSNDPDV